jgi:hypothetical protein
MALPTNAPLNFRSTFSDALRAYKKRTREDLFFHPLAARMQSCDSASAILYVLQEQVRNDEKWTDWLSPVVNAVHTLSLSLGEDVGLVMIQLLMTILSVRGIHLPFPGPIACENNLFCHWCLALCEYFPKLLTSDHFYTQVRRPTR